VLTRGGSTLGDVRLTEFWDRMNAQFGDVYAQSVAKDFVFDKLGGRTVDRALADGVDAKVVWRAVCDTFKVPDNLRLRCRRTRVTPWGGEPARGVGQVRGVPAPASAGRERREPLVVAEVKEVPSPIPPANHDNVTSWWSEPPQRHIVVVETADRGSQWPRAQSS
jgi:Protein of unknown function (DUF3046)